MFVSKQTHLSQHKKLEYLDCLGVCPMSKQLSGGQCRLFVDISLELVLPDIKT